MLQPHRIEQVLEYNTLLYVLDCEVDLVVRAQGA